MVTRWYSPRLPAMVLRWRADPVVQRAIVLAIGLRVGLGVVGWLTLLLIPASPPAGAHLSDYSLLQPQGSPLWGIVAPWQRDDGLVYQQIAERGYTAGGYDNAFFPLFPMLARVAGWLLGGSAILGALLVTSVATACALVLLHRIVAVRFGDETARWTVLFTALAPMGFFLMAPFTESLFLCTSLGAILAAQRDRYALAGVCAAAAALCRVQGALVLLAIAVVLLEQWRAQRLGARDVVRRAFGSLGIPLIAFGCFLLWATVVVGEPGGPLAAQHDWGRHLVNPLMALWDGFRVVITGNHPEERFNLAYAVLLLALLPAMWRRLPRAWTAYAAASALVPLFNEAYSTPLQSYARYALVVFPATVVIALGLQRARRWRGPLLLLSGALMVTEFFAFSHWHFVG